MKWFPMLSKSVPESIAVQGLKGCRDTKLHESLSYPYLMLIAPKLLPSFEPCLLER
jgi:hypothetical protein